MINELMQSNIDCVMDDINEFPDSWVELYNPTDAAINLKDYKIGLKEKASKAWQLPDKTVEGKSYVLVYCDKEEDGMHTDFRLETTKESSLYLFLGKDVADQVTFDKQPAPNIAYGRKTDGSGEWGYQLTPTPGMANKGDVCDAKHLLGEPVFSRKGIIISEPSSFTTGQGISLTLSLPEGAPEGTQIRYTLDGSEPQANSTLYRAMLSFDKTTVVRAKLFCQGWLSRRSTCHSYIFFPTDRKLTLPVISIMTNNRYLSDTKIGIYVDGSYQKGKKNYEFNWRRPVNVEYFETQAEDSRLNQLCETRVMGGASRGSALKSLALYANKRFGTKRLDYEFFPDQKPGMRNFKSVMLRNAGNDFDYLYMRDAIIQRTMASHADLDWQAWRPAIIYINGQYKGMLNIRERSNEDYVFTNYDELEDIDMIENLWELKEGTWDNFNDFKAFYAEHNHTLAEYEERMDCMEFINLMAMNLYYNNLDFPGNNFVIWRPTADGGKWRFIAKDTDFGLGLYDYDANYHILEWLHNPDYDPNYKWGANSYESTRLFRRLMEDADFKREFIDRCCIYMGDFLNEKCTRAVWDDMYEKIKTEFPFHRKLYMYNPWWPRPYDDELNAARNWLRQRTSLFYQQLGNYYQLGTPTPLAINKTQQNARISFNGVKLTEKVFDGKFFAGRSLRLSAETDAGQEIKGWTVLIDGAESVVTGNTLDMDMPSCQQLTINPIVGEATGIDNTVSRKKDAGDDKYYNLQGQPVSQPTKGIYIRNNHVVVVK